MSTLSKYSFVVFLTVAACSSDDSSSSSSGGSSSGSTSSSGSSGSGTSSSGNSGGTCSGEITGCGLGTLSAKQQDDMCSLILASIDDPPGTKFECKEGDKSGLFLGVNTKEQCVSAKAPAACKVTVGELVGCYKAAGKDACAAFADDGACAGLFDPNSSCQ